MKNDRVALVDLTENERPARRAVVLKRVGLSLRVRAPTETID